MVTYAHNNADGQEIAKEHLPPILFQGKPRTDAPMEKGAGREKTAFRSTVQESQRKADLAALQQAGGNKTEAAQILNVHRSALYKIMDRLKIAC